MQREKSENLWKNIGETEHVKRAGSNNAQEVRANGFENEQGDNFMNVRGEKSGHCVKCVNKQNHVSKNFEGAEIEPVHDESKEEEAKFDFDSWMDAVLKPDLERHNERLNRIFEDFHAVLQIQCEEYPG